MARPRVLIVDDEENIRVVLRDILAYSGYEATAAGTGPEGLAQAEAVHPDVILLDVLMQECDGYETCRRLKANPTTSHIPVILMTGMQDEALHRRVMEVGAVGCLMKPFRLETLVAAVKAARATTEDQAQASDGDRPASEGPA